MADTYLVEPDVGFIEEVSALGGEDLKKCFQCATCSVACPISPDNKPFPRKEMIAASWGLKDKLLGNADIWLCHNCGDCSTLCPRGAKPGDVLAAIRAYAIKEYATPKVIANAVDDPKKLPILLGIPALLFIIVGFITGLLDFTPELDHYGKIAHAQFFSTWLVDMFMIPASIWTVAIFALGLKRFIADIHENALKEGKTDKKDINPVEFVKALIAIIPKVLKHDKFTECTENTERSTQHMMVMFFIYRTGYRHGNLFCRALCVPDPWTLFPVESGEMAGQYQRCGPGHRQCHDDQDPNVQNRSGQHV